MTFVPLEVWSTNQIARLSLIDRADAAFSIVAQRRLLKVARSSLYWRPAAVSEDDLRLMCRIDELHLATPSMVLAASWQCCAVMVGRSTASGCDV